MKYLCIKGFWVILAAVSYGDTFTHFQTGKSFDGYATTTITGNKTVVISGGSKLSLNLAEYHIEYNKKSRSNTIAVIPINGTIEYGNQTGDFEDALMREADKGPIAIVLEIDTPGGLVHYTMKMCNSISRVNYCPVIAYVCGGENGGALSAGSVLSMACDKIYMAEDTVIGAATMVTVIRGVGVTDLESVMGEAISEKMRSTWRNQMAAVAQKNNRPGILAKAMEDKDIEVIEINRDGERMFISPVNKRIRDTVIKTWSSKDKLLTLSATDAVYCGIGDGTANTREELLRELDAAGCEVVINKSFDQAGKNFERANKKMDTILNSLNSQLVQLTQNNGRMSKSQFIKLLDTTEKSIKQLQLIKKKFPDIEIFDGQLQFYLNQIKAVKSSL